MDVPRDSRALRLGRRVLLAALIGALSGLFSAVFLTGLDFVTAVRLKVPTLVYALPLAGWLLGAAISRWAGDAVGGTSLVLETVHQTRGALDRRATSVAPMPRAMAPWVLFATWWTHLFGGSAGREGTAVQMGASLADAVSLRARVDSDDRRALLHAGIAAGFGSVFGTPCAGAIFALEVSRIGRLEGEAMLPAFVGAIVGDLVTRGVGVQHTVYFPVATTTLDLRMLAVLVAFGVAAGLSARVCIALTDGVRAVGARATKSVALRMAIGGALVVALSRLPGGDASLGLGVPTIVSAAFDPNLPLHLPALKLVLTAITIGSGFVGGEVTPLFFVGATLGNVLGRAFGVPLSLASGVMLPAVFAAAANAPIALGIMAAEVLGGGVLPHAMIVCVVAYFVSGHRSIYGAQRIGASKWGEGQDGREGKISEGERGA